MPVMPKEITKLIRKKCWSVLDRPLGLLLMRNLTFFYLHECIKENITSKLNF